MWLTSDTWHVNLAEVVAFRASDAIDSRVVIVLRSGEQVVLACDDMAAAQNLVAEIAEQVKASD